MKMKVLVLATALLSTIAVQAASADDVSELPCIDVIDGAAVADYVPSPDGWNLEFDVTLAAPSCTDASYTLVVTADSGLRSDIPGGTDSAVTLPGNGTDVLSYSVAVDDNDPTVCIHSETSGTITTGGPVDANENGTTVDDQHQTNEGNNKDGTKHDWETQSTTVSDRAPDRGCLSVSAPGVPSLPGDGAGARGYN